MKIDKDEFEFHVSGLFDRCMNTVANLLLEAGIAAVRLMTGQWLLETTYLSPRTSLSKVLQSVFAASGL